MASANALDPLEKIAQAHCANSPYRAQITPLFGKLNLLKLKDICKLEIAKKNVSPSNKS